MKLNYPIKYALMPIVEKTGYQAGVFGMEDTYDIVCYIVSKCYVLSDKVKYEKDGSKKEEYEVVFPYQRNNYSEFKYTEPSFNLLNNQCVNSNVVNKIFQTYEDALVNANEENDKLLSKSLSFIRYTEDINEVLQEKKKEFKEKLLKYKLLQKQILENTKKLDDSNTKKLDNLIFYSDEDFKFQNFNLYDFIKLFDSEKFIVYSVSREEYKKIRSSVNNGEKIDINEITLKPLLVNKDDNVEIISDKEKGKYYINTDYNTLEYCDISDENNNVTIDNCKNSDYIVLTTEKAEDVLESFKRKDSIDLNKIEEKNKLLKYTDK